MYRRDFDTPARTSRVVGPLVLVAALWLGPGPAYGQPPPGPGIRAAGLSEAFVAVADDASAVYWNPAGLAIGDMFSSVIERVETETETGDTGAQRFETRLLAVAVPSFGTSYYRLSSRQALGGGLALSDDGEAAAQPATGVALVTDQ